MTTINGHSVPDHYPDHSPSIDDLPRIIAGVENDSPCTNWDGDLKKDEVLCWLDNIYDGDPPTITPDDIDYATRHSGISIFLELTERQRRDLVRYFSGVFPGFPPYQERPLLSVQANQGLETSKNSGPFKGAKRIKIVTRREEKQAGSPQNPPLKPEQEAYIGEVCRVGWEAEANGEDAALAMILKVNEDYEEGLIPFGDLNYLKYDCDNR